MRRRLLLALMLLVSAPAAAQTVPTLPGADTRLQTMPYDPSRVVRLRVPLGYQTTLVLDPGEQVDTIAVGDSTAWQVTPSERGDHLFIKPLEAGRTTNLTVVTDVRIYAFELTGAYGPTSETPFTVRFVYPEAALDPAAQGSTAPAHTPYRLSGERRLRPLAISDDGERTFIEWSSDDDIPAVFAVDGRRREILVTGHMRDNRMVIDAVYPTLLFRLNREVARATRIEAGEDR